MALTDGPKLGVIVDGAQGELHYAQLMKRWRVLDSLIQANVISAAISAPPVDPDDGDTYIVATGATGDWSGHANKLARWSAKNSAWEIIGPKAGWFVWDNNSDQFLFHNGSSWLALFSTLDLVYDVGAYVPGVPTASQVLVLLPVVRAFTLPAGLSGSVGKATVAAAAATDFDITKNGVSIGTMSFALGATSATFTFTAAVDFGPGDVMGVIAPGTPDATLADISFVFAGMR